jgi:hypothetical protein
MTAAENPVVPKPRFAAGMLVLALVGAMTTAAYGYVAVTGWEPTAVERDQLPGDVRASPGGYRAFHFWHSGYHGGK